MHSTMTRAISYVIANTLEASKEARQGDKDNVTAMVATLYVCRSEGNGAVVDSVIVLAKHSADESESPATRIRELLIGQGFRLFGLRTPEDATECAVLGPVDKDLIRSEAPNAAIIEISAKDGGRTKLKEMLECASPYVRGTMALRSRIDKIAAELSRNNGYAASVAAFERMMCSNRVSQLRHAIASHLRSHDNSVEHEVGVFTVGAATTGDETSIALLGFTTSPEPCVQPGFTDLAETEHRLEPGLSMRIQFALPGAVARPLAAPTRFPNPLGLSALTAFVGMRDRSAVEKLLREAGVFIGKASDNVLARLKALESALLVICAAYEEEDRDAGRSLISAARKSLVASTLESMLAKPEENRPSPPADDVSASAAPARGADEDDF